MLLSDARLIDEAEEAMPALIVEGPASLVPLDCALMDANADAPPALLAALDSTCRPCRCPTARTACMLDSAAIASALSTLMFAPWLAVWAV